MYLLEVFGSLCIFFLRTMSLLTVFYFYYFTDTDLNATFFRLGDLLPNLKTGNTAPTQVHILQSAASYIRELRDNQSQLSSTRSSLVAENQRLQQRLSELRTICIA